MNSSRAQIQIDRRLQSRSIPTETEELISFGNRPTHSKISTMPFIEAVGLVQRHKYLAISWIALCLAIGSGYIYTTPKLYTASVSIVLNPSRQPGSSNSDQASLPSLDSSQTESQIQVLKSERILSAVFDALQIENSEDYGGGRNSPQSRLLGKTNGSAAVPDDGTRRQTIFEAFSNSVAVKRVGQSYVLDLSYTSKNRKESSKIVNSIAMQYLTSQIELKSASIQRGSEFLQGRITMIQAQLKAAKEGVLTGVVPNFQFPDADAQIISSAAPPLRKSAPKTGLVMIISVTFALATGLLFLLARTMLDKTVRSSSQIISYFSIPCVIAIPYIRRLSKILQAANRSGRKRETDTISDLRNLMSSLYTGVATSIPNSPEKIIGVFSWSPGAGKSTICASLAEVIALSGRQVLLIDFNTSPETISSNSIKHKHNVLDTNNDSQKNEAPLLKKVSPQLWIMNCSLMPGENLSSLRSVLEDMPALQAHRNHVVLIDLPAINSCAEVLTACQCLSYALLVVEANKTTLVDVERGITALKTAKTSNLGVVINKSK